MNARDEQDALKAKLAAFAVARTAPACPDLLAEKLGAWAHRMIKSDDPHSRYQRVRAVIQRDIPAPCSDRRMAVYAPLIGRGSAT